MSLVIQIREVRDTSHTLKLTFVLNFLRESVGQNSHWDCSQVIPKWLIDICFALSPILMNGKSPKNRAFWENCHILDPGQT